MPTLRPTLLLCLVLIGLSHGFLKGRRHKQDESVETLLAVGLIAKALADAESPPAPTPVQHCPAPVHVTKVVHVPIYKDRYVFVKDKDCEGERLILLKVSFSDFLLGPVMTKESYH